MLHKKTFTKKKQLLFLYLSSRNQHFRHLLQNPKPQKMKNESNSPIPPKKICSFTALYSDMNITISKRARIRCVNLVYKNVVTSSIKRYSLKKKKK